VSSLLGTSRWRRALIGAAPVVLVGCSLVVDTSGMSGGRAPVSDGDGGLDAGADAEAGVTDGDAQPGAPVLLSANGELTCAARGSSLFCWGKNDKGQLGDGSLVNRASPTPVVGLPSGDVTALGVGELHACAVVAGAVWCWGEGLAGELGDGRKVDSARPVKVSGVPAGRSTGICGGRRFSCALADGTAYCWGVNTAGQLGFGTTAVGAGTASVVTTGAGALTGATELSCGQDHACALTSMGVLRCWGHNDNGALGTPDVVVNDVSPRALPVQGLPGPASSVSIAGWHGCAVVGGAPFCWGTGTAGELGNGGAASTAAPVAVLGLTSGVTAIAAAGAASDGDATCAVRQGAVHCWGNGQSGRLGNGGISGAKEPVPVAGLPSTALRVAGGDAHFCAALEGGELRCWGRGTAGQLGDGTGLDRYQPVTVTLPK
jgi:alpha-tubulin suppressor-like RCC1 family protein